MTKRNRILLALTCAAVVAVSIWALRPQPVPVELAPVTRGPFEQTVSDDGKTRVRERYTVHSPLAGRLERISFKAGDAVAAGQVVALLTPTAPALLDVRAVRELQARLGAVEAQHLRSKAETARVLAQRNQANADFQRQVKLHQQGFVSAAVREQAELTLRTNEKAVEAARFAEDAARHDLEQARAALARYRSGGEGAKWDVVSPVSGSVLKVLQESEGAVVLGAPLLEIADARSLEAVVDVLSQESVTIRPGMPARLELGRDVRPLAARVRLVEPAAFTKISALGVEEQRVNVVLDFAEPLDRIQTIGDGFRVEAAIITYQVEDAVKVPVGALFRDGDGWAVFAVEGERALRRAVNISHRNAAEGLVGGGLKAGERVVVYPSDTLRNGTRIRAR